MINPRDDFSIKTKELLAKRVGFRCSNPSCNQLTSGPHLDKTKTVNVGVAAHITAASPNGPRYKASLSAKQRMSYSNGIWLCQKCGKLIDSDSSRYAVEILIQWKSTAENSAIQEIEGKTSKSFNSAKSTENKINAYEKLYYAVKEASADIGKLFKDDELSTKIKQETAFLVGLSIAEITNKEAFYLDHEVVVQSVGSFIGVGDIFCLDSIDERQLEIDRFWKNIRNTYRMIDSVRETGKLDHSITTPLVKYFNHKKNLQDKKDQENIY